MTDVEKMELELNNIIDCKGFRGLVAHVQRKILEARKKELINCLNGDWDTGNECNQYIEIRLDELTTQLKELEGSDGKTN